jgi:hypothetical protein
MEAIAKILTTSKEWYEWIKSSQER